MGIYPALVILGVRCGGGAKSWTVERAGRWSHQRGVGRGGERGGEVVSDAATWETAGMSGTYH